MKKFTSHGGLIKLCPPKLKLCLSPHLAMLMVMLFFSASVFAQSTSSIRGTVLDETGAALPGVNVVIKGSNTGTTTDIGGKFSINANKGTTLTFSFIGYTSKDVTIAAQQIITVSLAPTASNLDEVVVVGYGTQKKVTLTGAVSSIGGKEIVTTKNENVQNMLSGKVAGLRVVQNSAEPGNFTNSFDIRGLGNPLVVIDGIPRDNITRLDANDIESLSVLKDASAAVYGVRGANGVVLITTKKGVNGTLDLNYNGTFGWQVPASLPKSVDAIDYMTLFNEQTMHQVNGGKLSFLDADFAPYRNGTKTTTDWYTPVIKSSTPQVSHNLSATGGNEKTQYFLSAGYTYQDGLLRSEDLNYKRYNIRSNITSKITKDLTVNLNMSGIMDQKNQPYQEFWWITRSFWRQLPTQSIYANNNPQYLNNGQVDGSNPLALGTAATDGYKTLNNKWFQSSLSLEYKVPFVPGLLLKGLYNYDYELSNNKIFQKTYNQYTYNSATDTYSPIVNQSPSTIQRQFFDYPSDLQQLSLNYSHTFDKNHNITALVLYEQSQRSADNFAAQRELSIPVDQLIAGNSTNQVGNMDGNGATDFYKNANKAIVGRLTYDFKSKYLAEFSFREDGSSKFGPDHQWGFFPSGSVGYRVSEEPFWEKSPLSFMNSFKVRASYGIVGDDGNANYQFITGYNYPASGSNNQQPGGSVFDEKYVSAVQSKGLANPVYTWNTSKSFDAGIDLEAWNGVLGITFDYFIRNRTGLPATQILSLPDVVGVGLPQQNLNGDRNQGFDFSVETHNHIGDFNYNIKGTFSYVRTLYTTQIRAQAGNSYLNWRNNTNNRYNNIYWGKGAAYRYTDYASIVNSPVYISRSAVVGDYAYQDYNGDGVIDDNDTYPVARVGSPGTSNPIPMINYGLNISASYKNFDISMLFQGSGMIDVSYFEQLNTPLWGGGSALTQFLDRYHPVDPTANPYSQNTVWAPGHFAYTGSVPDQNSMFNIQSAAYVRLKSAELGYTLPKKLVNYLGIKSARIFVNGYNMLTFTKLKYLDPEHPSSTYGYLYPLDKLFSYGVSVKF